MKKKEPIQGGNLWKAKKVIAVALAGSLILGGSVYLRQRTKKVLTRGVMGEMENHPTQKPARKTEEKKV